MKSCYKTVCFIAAIILGASLTLSLAPFRLWIFSYFSLIGLIYLVYLFNIKKLPNIYSGYLGFFWGLGFFGSSVSWVFVSIYKYGGTNLYLSLFITVLFIAILSLFPAINLILLQKFKLTNPKNWNFFIAFPSSWVLMEIFRSWILTGFPWGLLGYTQLNTYLKYYASFFGVYGVSFIVAFIASLLVWAFYKKLITKILIINLILILYGSGFLCQNINLQSIFKLKSGSGSEFKLDLNQHKKLNTVAIIQGNIAPDDKFLFQDIETLIKRITEVYWQPTIDLFTQENLSKTEYSKIDLVIWPENSLPLSTDYSASKKFLNYIDQFAKKYNFGLLLGVPILVKPYKYNYFYNSVLGIGTASGVYHKINLVPFGDYVPLEKWLRGIINFFNLPMSSFVAGNTYQGSIIFNNNNILATVCYDIAYASQLRDRLAASNPSFIVAISEDGWFGDSLGPYQHLDITRMRAIETGKYILRAATSGVSAIIDNHGNIVTQTPMFKKTTLVGLYKDCFNKTIWNKIGNKPVIIFLITCFIIAIIARREL